MRDRNAISAACCERDISRRAQFPSQTAHTLSTSRDRIAVKPNCNSDINICKQFAWPFPKKPMPTGAYVACRVAMRAPESIRAHHTIALCASIGQAPDHAQPVP
ncbi:hypothetical protein C4900_00950 [Acidiferrobacter thiooxydans]|uniref:Uncharacterized protein n=1 Tax=Acidiferrobacter thiooxydans TaxID=163359 RepID=A0A368HIX3_9GAMM|nr:hypothetical protein C4900_00950 [Acidiferrobacter thiooxydans]